MSFWDSKLNGTAPPVSPVISRDMFGLYRPGNTPPPVSSPSSIPTTQDYTPNVRLKQGGRCPDCGSDKYLPYGSYAIACSECGYHPRFEQSGHGERSLKTKPGVARPARQSSDYQTMQGSIALLNAGGGEHIDSL